MFARLRSLIQGVFGRGQVESDMSEELRFHMDRRTEDLVRSGLTQEVARRRARLEFGAPEKYKEESREARGLRVFDELSQDLRYALRMLWTNPGFAAVAILSLGLGIGANVAIFSLLDAVLLKSLPVARPSELFAIQEQGRSTANRFSYPLFERLQRSAPEGTSVIAMSRTARFNTALAGERETSAALGQLVSGSYFDTLGVRAAAGRLLRPSDNQQIDGHPVAVISNAYWARRFASSPQVLGREIRINGTVFTIVGVSQQGFAGVWMESPTDIWVPVVMQSAVRYVQNFGDNNGEPEKPWIPQDQISWLDIVLRCPPGQAVRTAAALNVTYQQTLAQRAGSITDPVLRRQALSQHLALENFGRGFSNLRRRFGAPLLALMGMVAAILLIACANLANLLLARAAAREREIALRISIGAGRGRLVRQLLTESVVTAALGGIAGLLLANWTVAFLVRLTLGSNTTGTPASFALDHRVLAFAAGLSLASGILFGLVPAFRVTRVELSAMLKAGGRGVMNGSHSGGMRPLVVVQVALSLALILAAGLFARSLRNLSQVDPGYEQTRLLSIVIDPRSGGYPSTRLFGLYRTLVERIEAVPGVQSAAVSVCGLDLNCSSVSNGFHVEGYQPAAGERIRLQENFVGPKYFSTVGMHLLQGREFTMRDAPKTQPVAVINEAMARRYFSQRDPLGKHFGYDKPDIEIVGVVADARVMALRADAVPMVYYALLQGESYAESIDVRTTGDPGSIHAALRKAVLDTDPNLPVERVVRMTDQLANSVRQERMVAWLASAFGGLALLLACIGLYGVTSYAVARRTSELGVRMALGAPRAGVLWMVLRESLRLAAYGLIAGVPLVWVGSRWLQSMLFQVGPNDLTTLLGAVVVLGLTAALAGFVPAFRASRVDPLVALRYE